MFPFNDTFESFNTHLMTFFWRWFASFASTCTAVICAGSDVLLMIWLIGQVTNASQSHACTTPCWRQRRVFLCINFTVWIIDFAKPRVFHRDIPNAVLDTVSHSFCGQVSGKMMFNRLVSERSGLSATGLISARKRCLTLQGSLFAWT